ncbi:hypothetical protein LLB_1986 [Legionella longbeachae D-4968]|nr:hypothetical protein LLB_1986 [Legionella longbeachae D-4968]
MDYEPFWFKWAASESVQASHFKVGLLNAEFRMLPMLLALVLKSLAIGLSRL